MEDMSELTAEEQAKLLRHELEAVYGSSSYKIGRAVTWLPRNAKRGLKYLLHNRSSAQNISIPTRNIIRSPTKTTPTGPACKRRTTPRR